VFTGNIGEAQDFPAILDAAELLKSYSNIRWLIVGSGRMHQTVSDSIKKRHLENNIILCGHYPEEMMPAFFKLAKVLLVTLRNEPIFSATVPGKLQSYFEAKKPVVGMINGECSRIIFESKAGLTCPAGDSRALAKIILKMSMMSSKKLQSFGNNGFMHNQREYNQAILVDKIEKLLKNATLRKFKHAKF
jgi:glycosyltransferase involved in cell wall biosynthesis